MKTLNDTPLNDNQAIWFVKITDGTNTYRLATETIELDNTWDGNALNTTQSRFSLNEVGKRINLVEGGTIGQAASVTFGFKRNASNSLLADFFNEFYPATSGKVLSTQKVEIGIGWQGMTLDSEITWIQTYSVIDYVYDQSSIYLTCIEVLKLDAITLPYYEVQKEVDNGISYHLYAPEENYGIPLPIVYGDFTLYNDDYSLFKPVLFPIVCVDNRYQKYVCATHKFYDEDFSTGGGTASLAYQYVSGLKTYMTLICENGSATNSHPLAYVTHFDSLVSTDNLIYGTINIRPTIAGTKNEVADFTNLVDDDGTNTATSDSTGGVRQYIAAKIDGKDSPGLLSRAAGSIQIGYVASAGTVDKDVIVGYWNNEYNSGAGGFDGTVHITYVSGDTQVFYDMTNAFAARDITDEPWRWEELCNLEYYVGAEVVDTMTFKWLWLRITNIIVTDMKAPIQESGRKKDTYQLRNNMGNRGR